MCIGFFVLDPAPGIRFLLAFNRDEYIHRPTQPTHYWIDHPHVLGGRDVQAGGTWLGTSTRGRVALLTNLREADPDPEQQAEMEHKHSRGELPTNFLTSDLSPVDYCKAVQGANYHGFNLVCVDLTTGRMAYTNNSANIRPVGCACCQGETGQREWPGLAAAAPAVDCAQCSGRAVGAGVAQPLKPGQVYGVSNGLLGEWEKVQSGIHVLRQIIDEYQTPTTSNGAKNHATTAAETGVDRAAFPWCRVFTDLLSDSCRVEAVRPKDDTGHAVDLRRLNADEHIEYIASGRFVQPVNSKFGPYGTRSQTVMVVWSDGHTDLCERYLVPVGSNGVVSPPSNQQTSQETASGQADVSMAASAGRVEQSDGVQGQVHTGCNVCGSVSCEPPGTHFLGRTEGEARVGEWCWSRHSFDMTLKCN